jgi:hypothetical protein
VKQEYPVISNPTYDTEGKATYKYMNFGLDTGFIWHSPLTAFMITIDGGALVNSHNYSPYSAIVITQLQSTVCL